MANGLTFFVSFSSSGGSIIRSAFTPAIYDQFLPQNTIRPEPPEGFTERAKKYAGPYGFWRSNFSKIEKALGLGGGVQVAPTEDNTLVVVLDGTAKQYVEIEENLFRELDPNVSLISGISPALIAFQEDENGTITGFVMDGLPFMSLRKLPAYHTGPFNFALLGFAMLVFVGVVLRRFYQRATISSMSSTDRIATSSAVYAAGANLLVVVSGVIVLTIVQDELFSGIPLLFKLWLFVPIVATLAGLYLLFRNFQVWQQKQLSGAWARVRFSVVTLCAVFMCWFYYYWNILGFQFL